MTLSYMSGLDDGKPIFSTYLESLIQSLRGRYVKSGCQVSPVSGSLAVSVAAGAVVYDGEEYVVSAEQVTLNKALSDKDRADVIVWDYNDGSPIITKITGTRWVTLPDGSVVPITDRISDTQIPLAVVIVRANATEILATDIYDVRSGLDGINYVSNLRCNGIEPTVDGIGSVGSVYSRFQDLYVKNVYSNNVVIRMDDDTGGNPLSGTSDYGEVEIQVDVNDGVIPARVIFSDLSTGNSFALGITEQASDKKLGAIMGYDSSASSWKNIMVFDYISGVNYSYQDIYPSVDNTYNLGSSTNRWAKLYVKDVNISESLHFNVAEYLKKGIYAYKAKHSEHSHPTEIDDFVRRFLMKYLDNIQIGVMIDNLNHTFNDDYYFGLYSTMIYIAKDGNYDIGVNSDDASMVFIDGILATAWLNCHGVSEHWYQTSFNSVCDGGSDVDNDFISEPAHRTTLHPNGIYLCKGWHIVVAVFEEIDGGDRIEVYIRPHRDEDPSKAAGTNSGWKIIGSDAESAGYILDYRAIPIGYVLWMLNNQLWKSGTVSNPERGYVYVDGKLKINGVVSSVLPDKDNTYNLGSSTNRWANLYVVNSHVGDVVFENNWRISEYDDNGNLIDGLRILDGEGNEVCRITKEGIWFNGSKIV